MLTFLGGFTVRGTPTPISPDFSNLSKQWATLSPAGVKASEYSPSLTPPACPASTSGQWNVDGGVALPTVGQEFNADMPTSITGGSAAKTASHTGSASASSTSSAAHRSIRDSGSNFGLALITGLMVGGVFF
jgi:hypothetical protein